MEKLVIIDGHNLLFQMYYGMPNQILNKNSEQIHGVIGFVGGLKKIINMTKPDYLLVLFDGEIKLNRKDIDPEYKANRKDYTDPQDNPFCGIKHIQNCLNYMQIKYFETTDCECDDLIAKYVNLHNKDYHIDIVSSDKDFYCLVDNNVNVFTYRGKKSVRVTQEFITDKFGIHPKNFVLYKSLVGDNSDNIKGVLGIGPKTATKLINKYKTFENMIQQQEPLIVSHIDTINHNINLINFQTNTTLPYTIDALIYVDTQESTNQILNSAKVY